MKTRVVIVDDHPATREILRLTFEWAGMAVLGSVSEGAAALGVIADLQPDVLVLDVQLPDMNGLELATRLRADFPAVKILVFTGYGDDAALHPLLQLGVEGYLRKTAPVPEIAAAVRRIVAGEQVLDGDAARKALLGQPHVVTPREQEVLRLVARGQRNAEIAACLNITIKTVEYHLDLIRRKLGASSRVDLVNQARSRGLV
ncbi:MAG TPA: response regulator transcription factor [Chloroflexota bacterium]|nr:response regulator transcription factor [Chloroflexota bacterium]